jgi:hypothetical protein
MSPLLRMLSIIVEEEVVSLVIANGVQVKLPCGARQCASQLAKRLLPIDWPPLVDECSKACRVFCLRKDQAYSLEVDTTTLSLTHLLTREECLDACHENVDEVINAVKQVSGDKKLVIRLDQTRGCIPGLREAIQLKWQVLI